MVLVQGDTTTTLCGALAAFYCKVPVGHVEAGLRTGDPLQPFPEEMNRVLTTRLAALHFAATEGAAATSWRRASRARGSPSRATPASTRCSTCATAWSKADCEVRSAAAGPRQETHPGHGAPPGELRRGLRADLCRPGATGAAPRRPDRLPGASEPQRAGARGPASGRPGERSADRAARYVPFVDLMRRAHILLTDSGGIQEEGPSLGKPVLVMREKTERPEAVEAGTVRLVGTERKAHCRAGFPPAGRPGGVRAHVARSQPLRGWPGQRPHFGRNPLILQAKLSSKKSSKPPFAGPPRPVSAGRRSIMWPGDK